MSLFTKLFRPRSVKGLSILPERARAILIDMMRSGNVQYTDAADQIEQFRKVVWFYAAVRKVSDAAANIPFVLMKAKPGAEDTPVEKHEVLRVLESPNPIQTFRQIRVALHAFRQITGNSYIHKVRPQPGIGKVRQLQILYPNNMRVEVSNDAMQPKQYFYTRGGMEAEIPFDDVMHWAEFNPSSDIKGMSLAEPISSSLSAYNAGKQWNNNLLKNDARPPGMMKVTGNLTDQQFEQARKRVQDQIQGAHNAGAPVVMDADMDWVPFAVSPKDLDWSGLMNMTREEIATALNVPAQLLNDQTSQTFANYEQAMIALYQYNVIPSVAVEMELWTRHILEPGSGLYFKPDFSGIEVLQKAKLADWEKINAAWELTPNQRLELKGLPTSDDPLMDKVYIPSNFTPLEAMDPGGDDAMPPRNPKPDTLPEDEDEE